MGTRWKINAIWWNIKINIQKLVVVRGYELPTNLQNFTQKDLTKVKILQNVLGGYFFWNTLYMYCICRVARRDKKLNVSTTSSTVQSVSVMWTNVMRNVYHFWRTGWTQHEKVYSRKVDHGNTSRNGSCSPFCAQTEIHYVNCTLTANIVDDLLTWLQH